MLVNLTTENLRKFYSILKVQDQVLIVCRQNNLYLFGDTGEYFKALVLPLLRPTEDDLAFKVSSDDLAIVVREGIMLLMPNIEDKDIAELKVGFTKNEETLSKNSFETYGVVKIEMVPKGTADSFMNLLAISNSLDFSLEVFTHAKDLITACSMVGSDLNISDGIAMAHGNVKVFSRVGDPELSFGITSKCLGEISKFGTNCDAKIVKQYVILNRGNNYLGIKKAVNQSNRIPDMYLKDELAMKTVYINMDNILTLLANQNSKIKYDKIILLEFDFKNNSCTVKYPGKYFQLFTPVVKCIENQDCKQDIAKICLALDDVKSITKLLKGGGNVKAIHCYPNIVRITNGTIESLVRVHDGNK